MLLVSQVLWAQTQFAGWAATFQNYKLNSRIGVYFDGQWRSTGQVQQMHALLLRPGVNFYFNPSFTGTVGYAFIPQLRSAGEVTGYLPEHRVWEQMVFTHRMSMGKHRSQAMVSHRVRLEQRHIPRYHREGNALAGDGHHYAGRLRYFVRGVVPMGQQTARFEKGWFAALQNEIFFNTGGYSSTGKTFDQNRAYLAAGYRLSSQLDLEMGYMNQYISGAGQASTNNHILQVATYLRL